MRVVRKRTTLCTLENPFGISHHDKYMDGHSTNNTKYTDGHPKTGEISTDNLSTADEKYILNFSTTTAEIAPSVGPKMKSAPSDHECEENVIYLRSSRKCRKTTSDSHADHHERGAESSVMDVEIATTRIICEWAHKLLGRMFDNLTDLSTHLVEGGFVSRKSAAASLMLEQRAANNDLSRYPGSHHDLTRYSSSHDFLKKLQENSVSVSGKMAAVGIESSSTYSGIHRVVDCSAGKKSADPCSQVVPDTAYINITKLPQQQKRQRQRQKQNSVIKIVDTKCPDEEELNKENLSTLLKHNANENSLLCRDNESNDDNNGRKIPRLRNSLKLKSTKSEKACLLSTGASKDGEPYPPPQKVGVNDIVANEFCTPQQISFSTSRQSASVEDGLLCPSSGSSNVNIKEETPKAEHIRDSSSSSSSFSGGLSSYTPGIRKWHTFPMKQPLSPLNSNINNIYNTVPRKSFRVKRNLSNVFDSNYSAKRFFSGSRHNSSRDTSAAATARSLQNVPSILPLDAKPKNHDERVVPLDPINNIPVFANVDVADDDVLVAGVGRFSAANGLGVELLDDSETLEDNWSTMTMTNIDFSE